MNVRSLTFPPQFAMLLLWVLLSAQLDSYAADQHASYQHLALAEEPLAVEMGDVTLSLRGTLEALGTFRQSINHHEDIEADFNAAVETRAEMQLLNYWTLQGSYIFNVDTRENDEVQHEGSIGLRGSQGELFFGHVSDRLRHISNRNSSAGNAELAYDHSLSELDDLTLSHIFEQGPLKFGGVADFVGNFELGAIYQRPIAQKDLRFSLRLTKGTFDGAGGPVIKGIGGHGVSELVYSNWTMNLGGGFEYLTSGNMDAQRYYLSSGLARKVGAVTLSVEGHYSKTAGSDEISASAGASYDFARGASVNAGLNYKKADVNKDGIQILDDDATELILSLRYSF